MNATKKDILLLTIFISVMSLWITFGIAITMNTLNEIKDTPNIVICTLNEEGVLCAGEWEDVIETPE